MYMDGCPLFYFEVGCGTKFLSFDGDGGNLAHIAEHGIARGEQSLFGHFLDIGLQMRHRRNGSRKSDG